MRARALLRHPHCLTPVASTESEEGGIVIYVFAGRSLEEVRRKWYRQGLSHKELEARMKVMGAQISLALDHVHSKVRSTARKSVFSMSVGAPAYITC
jgi:hypothetical protein